MSDNFGKRRHRAHAVTGASTAPIETDPNEAGRDGAARPWRLRGNDGPRRRRGCGTLSTASSGERHLELPRKRRASIGQRTPKDTPELGRGQTVDSGVSVRRRTATSGGVRRRAARAALGRPRRPCDAASPRCRAPPGGPARPFARPRRDTAGSPARRRRVPPPRPQPLAAEAGDAGHRSSGPRRPTSEPNAR